MNKNNTVDYNELMNFKRQIESLYTYLKKAHNDILKLIDDADCIEEEKLDKYYSHIKEYESKIELLKSNFLSLSSENKKIESVINQTKLLKKRRLTKIASNIEEPNDDGGNDVSDFFDLSDNEL